MEKGVLTRNGLGRIQNLGDLYDARTDMFTGDSVVSSSTGAISFGSAGPVDEKDISFSDISNTISSNLKDRFDQLDIKGELKLSVLCGLVEVKGSVKYLTEEAEDHRLLCSSLVYKTKTKQHNLRWFDVNSLRPHLCMESITDPGYATHFVSAIEWGFNITITARTKATKTTSKEQIDGAAEAMFKKLKIVTVEGKVDLNKLAQSKVDDKDFDFRIYGDIDFPTELSMPSSFEEAVGFIVKAPNYLPKTNKGKGVPVTYTLQPLPKLQQMYNLHSATENLYLAISDEAVTQCFEVFEDYAALKERMRQVERELDANRAYASSAIVDTIRDLKRAVLQGEAAYKSQLMDHLTKVRSGEKAPAILQEFLNKFLADCKNSPQFLEDQLTVFNWLKEKVGLLKSLQREGVLYVGAGHSLTTTCMKERRRRTIYVLNYFETIAVKKGDALKQALDCFVSLQKQQSEDDNDTLFIFADRELNLDAPPLGKKPEMTISKLVSGKVTQENLIPDLLANMVTDLACSQDVESTFQPSANTVTLMLQCPGYTQHRRCTTRQRSFSCLVCRSTLQYDYQSNKIVCKCGVFGPSTAFFKCSDAAHGDEYVKFSDLVKLNQLLASLRPKEYNILILGETGVGKSTWINGILNYATYETLEDALGDPPLKYFIPSRFTIADPKNKVSKSVFIGEPDANECYVKGKSATQMPRPYSFLLDGAVYRLIDTPGLGDTEGLEQDEKNVDNILRFLAQYKELHGIAILMKPNNSRLNVLFDFCLKELLRHLHRDARKNIIFVFTNARGTFYKPGDTYDALEAVLSANPSIGLTLTHENIYCMDNEPVRFLAACSSGIEFTAHEKGIFSESWDKAFEETSRLIQHIRHLPPHGAEDTVTLNAVRRQISALTRPLAHITENINHNIQACKDQTKLIEEREKKKKGLEDVLFVPFIDLKQVPLGFPQTVCAAGRCVEVRTLHGQNVNHYKTICHDHCYLTGVPLEAFPEPRLQGCTAMGGAQNCSRCGCHWNVHQHITYTHESVETKVEDATTKDHIMKETQEIQKAQNVKKTLNERITEYRHEEKMLLEASAEFGSFLKHNAILPYNDALKAYLMHMISEESKKQRSTNTKSPALESLEASLRQYNEEVRVLQKAMEMGTKKPKSPDEIQNMIKAIFKLKHFGSKVREGLEANSAGQTSEYKALEVGLHVRVGQEQGFFGKIYSGAKGKLKKMTGW